MNEQGAGCRIVVRQGGMAAMFSLLVESSLGWVDVVVGVVEWLVDSQKRFGCHCHWLWCGVFVGGRWVMMV